MSFIKKTYDFFANWIRRCQREHCPRGYARVNAATLKNICACINLSSPDSKKYAHHEFPRISAEDEKKFLSAVADAKLQQHIRLSNDPGQARINFENIMVEDTVELNLGGNLCYWDFNCVKFCRKASITIFPPYFNPSIGGMTFRNSVCFSEFECWFYGVPSLHISDSKFMSSILMEVSTGAGMADNGLIDKMKDKFLEYSHIPSIRFSGNHIKGILLLFLTHPTYKGHLPAPTLGEVRFGDSNYIGALYLSHAISLKNKTVEANSDNIVDPSVERALQVHDIHFGTYEYIKMPFHKNQMLDYKNFFIALKNRAIDKRDREAEFGYARKERYFDRGLATHWQDKFTLGWSHYVSDSGISWARPIICLLAVQAILAAAFIGWNDWTCACDWSWRVLADWGVWAEMFVKSLNPLNSVDSKCASTLSAAIYGVAQKIFLFLFLYEIIKVFRRFSK